MAYKEAPTYEISFMFRRILVPIDGSENSLKALDLAADLAKHYGSHVTVIFAKPKGYNADFKPLEKARKRIENKGIDAEFKELEFDPAENSTAGKILEEIVNGNYDLVVMGARGRTLSSEITIGSKALSIASNSPVTVIIVR
ncbi:UspA domain protein [Staphylothermus marinus F1]|uniref:UspA domain protein n=1 Tax=Staphylothermus marinus (strain ATCC 43588 / DSM 3639 / JCM 9404 / F1) TaxID=399550 RepID=A3DL45_STAMF|nr:universal stress protein [Staphylothermus marinus]ABN69355.1 UspA domain protein [Staphylothermus marinus F1]